MQTSHGLSVFSSVPSFQVVLNCHSLADCPNCTLIPPFQDLREAKYKMEAAASELRSKVNVSEEASGETDSALCCTDCGLLSRRQ